MNHTHDFVRQIAAAAELRSTDYAFGKHMALNYGWSQRTGINIRKGISIPDDAHALDIANELGLPPAYVLACIAADRTRDETVRSKWEEVAETLRRTAAAVILSGSVALAGVAGMFAPSAAYASVKAGASTGPIYIMRILRRLLRWLDTAADDALDVIAA